jgi:hypothetical protein
MAQTQGIGDAEETMDPVFIDNDIWHKISTMLRFLWVYMAVIIGFAFNFLVAHAFIPSLAGSGQLPLGIAKLRPVFYMAAAGFLVVAITFFALTVSRVDVITDIWNRRWI